VAVVRYLVDDVETAIVFYTDRLGSALERRMGPAFAIVSRGDLLLWLSGPQSSAARPMPDERLPEPGGWNRLVVEVDDLEAKIAELKQAGLSFRNEIGTGPGGKQIPRRRLRQAGGAVSARLGTRRKVNSEHEIPGVRSPFGTRLFPVVR
jgi:catechol 2,3-dioxygenase-like lactoylglutathione lyase family enzyme